jgi:pyruvate formate lyase activating enzyme
MDAMSVTPAALPLARALGQWTREGSIYEREGDGGVRCFACGHRCFIPAGRSGVCRVRFNEGGILRVPWGYVAGLQCDPIEKKPFFHALPGARALSFGMLGCDLHCAYCQNWITSQTLRDPDATAEARPVEPREIAALAQRLGAPVIASTYNEPLITSEWGVEVLREAARLGILGAYVSNGNGTERVLDFIEPWVRICKVDLKSFRDRTYRSLGGTLEAVLRTIESLWRRGIWLEIVTLIVPGLNDTDEEIREIAGFLRGLSPEIPWHLTAFHPDYRMSERPATASDALVRAATLARSEGMRFVYAGNRPGDVGEFEDTRCPGCGFTLVSRRGYVVQRVAVDATGACARCARPVPGVWHGGAQHPALPAGSSGAAAMGGAAQG